MKERGRIRCLLCGMPIPDMPEDACFEELLCDSCNNRCTCDEREWEAHECPFAADVWNDHDSECTCCPNCTDQCAADI